MRTAKYMDNKFAHVYLTNFNFKNDIIAHGFDIKEIENI